MKAIKNTKIYIENQGIVKTSISFDETVKDFSNDAKGEVLDLPENALVLPAFIDIHIHGANNSDVMDGTENAFENISKYLPKEGTASFLATTLTESTENLVSALSCVKNYKEKHSNDGAEVIGVHLEGPFISEKYKGAQPEKHILKPQSELFDRLNEVSGNSIKLVTLAPEIDGADELITHLAKNNIIPAVAHSNAKFADVEKAVALGLKSVTHTYNAQSPLHHRDIGVVGAGLILDELYCELIADTIHVSVPAMKLLFKNKPNNKIVLVTDALRAKGFGEGSFIMGGQKVTAKGAELRLENGALAGSILGMNKAVKNVIDLVGIPLEKAVDCATINPARLLGIDKQYGSIAVGKNADFVIVNDNFDVLYTIKNGKVIYKA